MISLMQIKLCLREAGWPKEVTNSMSEAELNYALENDLDRYNPYEPSINDKAFESYILSFKEDVKKHGFERTYCNWVSGRACGCMGPQDGDPYCPCEMCSRTERMMGKVVPNEI